MSWLKKYDTEGSNVKMSNGGPIWPKPAARQGSVLLPGESKPSTHLYASGKSEGKHYAFPTLFQTAEGSWYQHADPFEHSLEIGEALEFNKARHAKKYAKGAWKQEMAYGGLIKRADGSYSKRGLWDNIRANKGSGKKPTKEMLEQERKIKAKMEYGGWLNTYEEGGPIEPEPPILAANLKPVEIYPWSKYDARGKLSPKEVYYADEVIPNAVRRGGKEFLDYPVSKMTMGMLAPLTIGGIAGAYLPAAASVTPLVSATGAAANAPILGVPGLTANNLLWGLGALASTNEIVDPNSATRTSINKAIEEPTVGNVAQAAGNTGLTALGYAGIPLRTGAASLVDDLSRAGQYFPEQSFNLEELRKAYHNSSRFLTPQEITFLHKNGFGSRQNYSRSRGSINLSDEYFHNRELANNQLSLPPSEVWIMEDGTTRNIYGQRPSWEQNWGTNNWNPNSSTYTKPNPVNKSGLTKDEVLQKVLSKDKDVVSKMSEDEFKNTVLKPTGEIVPYYSGAVKTKSTGLTDAVQLTRKEYVDEFNSKLDLLNDIIARNNKSGIEYRVKGLNEDGRLVFYTPEQKIPLKLSDKAQKLFDSYKKDPTGFAIKYGGLQKDGKVWKYNDELYALKFPEGFPTKKDAVNAFKKQINNEILNNTKLSGESTWTVNINPGQWRGDVQDIMSEKYFRDIPGLEMSNTTGGVFPDRLPRRGSGTYESINQYLKALDLGRVKPGFNSQTDFSRGAWENFIKSGKGVGYYANPRTVYGTMKSVLPYMGAGYFGYKGYEGLQQPQQTEQKQMGGWLNKYN